MFLVVFGTVNLVKCLDKASAASFWVHYNIPTYLQVQVLVSPFEMAGHTMQPVTHGCTVAHCKFNAYIQLWIGVMYICYGQTAK